MEQFLSKQFNASRRVQPQSGPEKASVLSVIVARSWALKVLAKFGASQCSQNFALHIAIALHLALALLLAIAVMILSS